MNHKTPMEHRISWRGLTIKVYREEEVLYLCHWFIKETFNILVRMQWHYVRDVCVCVFLSVGLNLRPCHTSRTLPRLRCTCEWKSTPTGCSLPAILQSVHRRLDATPTYWMNEWMNKWECRSLTCSQKPTGSQCQTKRLMGKLERKRNCSAVHSPWRQSDGCGGGTLKLNAFGSGINSTYWYGKFKSLTLFRFFRYRQQS